MERNRASKSKRRRNRQPNSHGIISTNHSYQVSWIPYSNHYIYVVTARFYLQQIRDVLMRPGRYRICTSYKFETQTVWNYWTISCPFTFSSQSNKYDNLKRFSAPSYNAVLIVIVSTEWPRVPHSIQSFLHWESPCRIVLSHKYLCAHNPDTLSIIRDRKMCFFTKKTF